MGLVLNMSDTVLIPNENHSAVIKKLSHLELKEASKVRQSEGIGFMREVGGELLKALRDSDTEKVKKLQELQAADITNYDRNTLLKSGILSWTYEIALPDGTDYLDEPTAKYLAECIFNFSRPETPVEAKNA